MLKAQFEEWYVEQDHVVAAIERGVDVLESFDANGVEQYVWEDTRNSYARWMMPGALKPSHVIELAKHSPAYPYHEGWLCTAVWKLREADIINDEELARVKATINESLSGHMFLRTLMINTGIIDESVRYSYPEYLAPAVAHWDALIAKLRAEGN